jgi:hypothetical protein
MTFVKGLLEVLGQWTWNFFPVYDPLLAFSTRAFALASKLLLQIQFLLLPVRFELEMSIPRVGPRIPFIHMVQENTTPLRVFPLNVQLLCFQLEPLLEK